MFTYDTVYLKNAVVYIIRYESYCLNDYFSVLFPTELERINQFSSDKRKAEFLATRILKESIFPKKLIEYNEEGRPYIDGVPYISISHCKGCSAIAVSNEHIIGLDIEPIGEKARLLHEKFLNEREKSVLNTEDALEMTRAWSCKETLLKLSGRKGILFKKDILIDAFDGEETFFCSVFKKDKKFSVHLTSKVINQMVLTINHTNLQADEFA